MEAGLLFLAQQQKAGTEQQNRRRFGIEGKLDIVNRGRIAAGDIDKLDAEKTVVLPRAGEKLACGIVKIILADNLHVRIGNQYSIASVADPFPRDL